MEASSPWSRKRAAHCWHWLPVTSPANLTAGMSRSQRGQTAGMASMMSDEALNKRLSALKHALADGAAFDLDVPILLGLHLVIFIPALGTQHVDLLM